MIRINNFRYFIRRKMVLKYIVNQMKQQLKAIILFLTQLLTLLVLVANVLLIVYLCYFLKNCQLKISSLCFPETICKCNSRKDTVREHNVLRHGERCVSELCPSSMSG